MNGKEIDWLNERLNRLEGKVDVNSTTVTQLTTRFDDTMKAVLFIAGGLALVISGTVSLLL